MGFGRPVLSRWGNGGSFASRQKVTAREEMLSAPTACRRRVLVEFLETNGTARSQPFLSSGNAREFVYDHDGVENLGGGKELRR